MHVLWGIGGMVAILAIAFALSTNRRAIRPRTVLGALAIQVGFGFIVLHWDAGQAALAAVSDGVRAVMDSSAEGIDFLFGPLIPEEGMVFALQVLPLIVFVASLSAVLYHLHILQWMVRIIGGGLQRALGISRPESLNAAANIFLGQTEAPLIVRPYLASMTRSEFFAVMVGGLSTVAGTVLVGYAKLGARLDYLIAASFMAAPAALLMAKIIIPETESPGTAPAGRSVERTGAGGADREPEAREEDADAAGKSAAGHGPRVKVAAGHSGDTDAATSSADGSKPRNVIDAAANGAADGLKLALNVGAMLLAFISLVALLNLVLGAVGGLFGLPDLTFQQILGYVFSPVMVAIGVPWDEAVQAASYLGEKIVLNEFVAFSDFAPNAADFSSKTATIITFALTGFANLSSLAILLGGLGSLVPQRRSQIAQLGIRAIIAGTLANLMSAAIAGILIG